MENKTLIFWTVVSAISITALVRLMLIHRDSLTMKLRIKLAQERVLQKKREHQKTLETSEEEEHPPEITKRR